MDYQERILEMANERGGFLTAPDVLEEAKSVDSVLHSHFEWDDGKAAAEYRLEQARGLIQSVRITFDHAPSVRVQALVSLSSDRKAGGGYRLLTDVIKGPASLKDELLGEMRAKVRYWIAQCEAIAPDKVHILRRLSDEL